MSGSGTAVTRNAGMRLDALQGVGRHDRAPSRLAWNRLLSYSTADASTVVT